MVKFNEALLDRTFAALSDPTRRALLARLSERDLSISELARPLAMSLPAVMKHVDVLCSAGLVTRSKTGRTVACRLCAGPMQEAMQWLDRYQRFWSASLDRLAALVEEPQAPDPAARPEAGLAPSSTPRPAAMRGRRPKTRGG
ncbi:ArsR/SmtB family transcription factor [Paraburkholderia sp.]|uniref:ArsR/SmtB family transcription factor n=1 Tax=Paraburkholderia sp. TaxID=1926495 RepID=UPI0039E3362F